MTTILPYNPKVEILWATPNPAEVVTRACSVTQKGIFAEEAEPNAALMRFLLQADHGSPLEHAVISFDITQISRACADQIRTHRMASHTMSSTHYQDHSDYPHRVDDCEFVTDKHLILGAIEYAMAAYHRLTAHRDVPASVARQILPLSIEVRYILTINARSLAKFLTLRTCYRNTIETILTARVMHVAAITWFPEIFNHLGKPCDFTGCKEGKMKCDKPAVREKLAQYV